MVKSKKTISTLGSYAGYKSGIIKNPLTLVKSGPCQFWFDGKDNSKLSLNDNKVIHWYDKSGFDRNVSNDINEQRPIYDPATGRVTFTSAAQTYLQSAAFDAPLEQPNTIFILYKLNVAKIDDHIIFDTRVGRQFFASFNNKFRFSAGITVEDGENDLNDNIHCAEFNSPDGALTSNYWKNGILVVNSVNTGGSSLDGITLGARNDLSRSPDVEICEVFGYNNLIIGTERIKCENYMYNKWALTY